MNLGIPGVYLCREPITVDRFERLRSDMVADLGGGLHARYRPRAVVVHPSDEHDAATVTRHAGRWRVQPDADVTPGTFWLVDEVRIERDGHDCDSAMRHATFRWWDQVYDLLMQYGAKESTRGEFLDYHCHERDRLGVDYSREFRFMGRFGFGGKLRTEGMRWLRADYYSEDRTPERDRDCAALNEALKAL